MVIYNRYWTRSQKTGKRRQRSESRFKSKEDAEVAAVALLSDVKQGNYIKESDIIFKDFAKEWLRIYKDRTGAKPGTIRLREYGINRLLPYFAHLKLKKITEEMYQAALDNLKNRKGQNLARSTKEGIHTTGKMIFKMATRKKLIKDDPAEFAYIKKEQEVIVETDEEELPNFFEKEELLKFMDTALEKGLYMDYLIFLTLAYTGMRIGELVALKWKDIDFINQTINITKTYYNPSNNTLEYILVTPKTKRSRRKIIVEEEVIKTLLEHKKAQEKVIEQLGDAYYNKDFIFAKMERQHGYPIVIKTVQNRMAGLLNQELTPHSLRHTHTSLLAEAGVALEQIMDRLGHSDDQITKDVYLHVTQEMKKDASAKVKNLYGNVLLDLI